MPETHEMIQTGTDMGGNEIWECPICTRTLLFRWPPEYYKKTLIEGNASVSHVAGKGGLMPLHVEVPE